MNKQVYKLCLLGATDKQIADFFDVDESTITRWKQSEPEFCTSLKAGKEDADATIAQSLFHRAKGYVAPDIITAQKDGIITDIKEVEKHYPPDTTAAIFWLKNRQPKNWRDKQEVEQVNLNYDMSEEEANEILKRYGKDTDS
jgi:hypothetical protein